MFVVDGAQRLHFAADHVALLDDQAQRGRIEVDGDAAGDDAIHQEPVAEQLRIEAHPVFLAGA